MWQLSATIEVFNLYKKCKTRMKTGGFNLRKWKSNDKVLLKEIDRYEQTEFGDTVVPCKNEEKVLGVKWDTENDNLVIDFRDLILEALNLPVTKCSILRTMAGFFDPFGFITPVTIVLKMIFQQVCSLNVEMGWSTTYRRSK